jgi:hypothetical protein
MLSAGRASFDMLPDDVPSLLDTFDFYRIDSTFYPWMWVTSSRLSKMETNHLCVTGPVRPLIFLQVPDMREFLRATSNTPRGGA